MSQAVSASSIYQGRASPIIKWAGGKGSLLAQYDLYFPSPGSYGRYIEPFLGGAAVFFYLQPPDSLLFDLNAELIELYQVVRDDVEALIAELKTHVNQRDHYYRVRAQKPDQLLLPVERAARFIFLNRTCYNGLYRVNRQGQFNVPFGRYKNPNICDESGLRAASKALKNAFLRAADFAHVLSVARAGDLIYFDPPYEPLSPTSSFTSYTAGGFTTDDQRRLADVYRELDDRGCLLMLSNSNSAPIYELYDGYRFYEIYARRVINSKANGRGAIKELLITNYHSAAANTNSPNNLSAS
jgi:DNA adenine methylase